MDAEGNARTHRMDADKGAEMIDILKQLSADPNVSGQMRQILAGEKPTLKMKSTHADSLLILQSVADELCATNERVGLLQSVYELGRIDGAIEQNKDSLELLRKYAV